MNNDQIEKISKFFPEEFLSRMSKISMFKNEDGIYELFNKYSITRENNQYKLTNNFNSNVKYFGFLKNAITYCIFENKNKFHKANRVEFLDTILNSIEFNITAHRNLINKSNDIDYKLIYAAKLSEELNKKKLILNELSSYIMQSKKFIIK